nr:uncharacterized protein LOC116769156 [Danaus plexippus plexippus]
MNFVVQFFFGKRGSRYMKLNDYIYTVQFEKKLSDTTTKIRWYCRGRTRGYATFTLSRRGNRQITLKGFTFSTRKLIDSHPMAKRRWYCSTHHSKGCSAYILTVDDMLVAANNNHVHK